MSSPIEFWFYVAEGHARPPEPEAFIPLVHSDLDGGKHGWNLGPDGTTLHVSREAWRAEMLVELQGGRTLLERILERVHERVVSPVMALGTFPG